MGGKIAIWVAPALLFAGLALAALGGLGSGAPQSGQDPQGAGRPAPAITAPSLAGMAAVDPDDLTEGQVTLVNFWASWCAPCRAEHPRLMELAASGLRIVGVNYSDKQEDAARYIAENGNPFAAIPVDPEGQVARLWGVAALPETFILAADGTVLFRFAGPLVGSDYEQRFRPQLERALARQSEPGRAGG